MPNDINGFPTPTARHRRQQGGGTPGRFERQPEQQRQAGRVRRPDRHRQPHRHRRAPARARRRHWPAPRTWTRPGSMPCASAIAEGEYSVDSVHVADKLIALERDLFGRQAGALSSTGMLNEHRHRPRRGAAGHPARASTPRLLGGDLEATRPELVRAKRAAAGHFEQLVRATAAGGTVHDRTYDARIRLRPRDRVPAPERDQRRHRGVRPASRALGARPAARPGPATRACIPARARTPPPTAARGHSPRPENRWCAGCVGRSRPRMLVWVLTMTRSTRRTDD
ncbi:MAG: hypothetical protein MZV65_52235 [Chromatiales bacterium]|nr:hypothetical protein [Chromatiales bacterium]